MLLPAWTTQQEVQLSVFPDIDTTTTRLRRLERSHQFTRRGSIVESNSDFTNVSSATVDSSGAIVLSSTSGLAVQGAMPPFVVSGNFAYTSDGTSIHWYWDGTNSSNALVIKRADGTNFSVPKGDLNITGLANSTTYYFYPFWNLSGGCAVSFVKGTAGSPQFAATVTSKDSLQAQSLLGREALSSGAMTAATTAGAGGSGTAGGGGGVGKCVMSGTDIEPLLPEWEYETRIHPQSDWVRIISKSGESVNVVEGHRFYFPDGEPVRVENLKGGDWLVHKKADMQLLEVRRFIRVCTKWEVVMKRGHLYFANGFLSHNQKAEEA